ncbi:MAG TPA: hypothetical protein VF185_00545 [Patescibacteria group bacterium]
MRQKGFSAIIVVIAALAIALIAGGVVYFGSKGGYNAVPATQQTSSPTPVTLQTPTPTPSTTSEIQGGKLYTSQALGASFSYPTTAGVKEVGNKIYVYMTDTATGAEGGQYIEMFEKPKDQSIDDAIKEKFLAGKPDFCTVRVSTQDNSFTNYQKREIAYPTDDNSGEPWFAKQEQCGPYSISNGIAYFIYDPAHPTQYAYLSIGQYGITFDNNSNPPQTWQSTIKFLK